VPYFHRKQYNLFAKLVSTLQPEYRQKFFDAFVDVFQSDNPAFDKELFAKACKVVTQ